MSKQTVKVKKNKTIIVNQLSNLERANERVLNAISSGMIQGLFPLVLKQKKKECYMEVTINDLVPLNLYFSRNGVVSKPLFLNVVHQIANIAKSCEKTMMSSNNLDLNMDHIFVEIRTGKVKCIYWPIVNNEHEMPIQVFFKQLPNRVALNTYENKNYINEYIAFFNTNLPFSLNSFEKMVARLAGKENKEKNMPTGAMTSHHVGEEAAIQLQSKDSGLSVEYDPFAHMQKEPIRFEVKLDSQSESTKEPQKEPVKIPQGGVFCSQCGAKNSAGANFCKQCGNKLVVFKQEEPIQKEEHVPQPYIEENIYVNEGTTVLGDETGGTTVLGFDEPELSSYPYLIRERTGDKILIDKPVFRIGKEKKYCDYFVLDNNAVSRSHADIITRDKRYYIIDLHSTNRTYVDDRVVPIEVEVEIFSGTRVKLANENFTFHIEA